MDLQLFRSLESRGFECLLCPHHCVLTPGMQGICRVRTAGHEGIFPQKNPVTVIAEDPIEKKPFYHFLPGSRTLSIGFSGCNMRCPFCQNHELVDSVITQKQWNPESILRSAVERNSSSVCFTYSEPSVHIEFLIDCASLLRKAGIPVLLVTNGCINPEPARWLLQNLSAVKVDLKSFSSSWYKNELKGDLETVCRFIETAYEFCHLEVVSLIIPGRNDSRKELTKSSEFISGISKDIPFHLTAYFPQHKYSISPTSTSLLLELQKTALAQLNHVYTGNTGLLENTYCSECGVLLIDRKNGKIQGIDDNECINCKKILYGCFD